MACRYAVSASVSLPSECSASPRFIQGSGRSGCDRGGALRRLCGFAVSAQCVENAGQCRQRRLVVRPEPERLAQREFRLAVLPELVQRHAPVGERRHPARSQPRRLGPGACRAGGIAARKECRAQLEVQLWPAGLIRDGPAQCRYPARRGFFSHLSAPRPWLIVTGYPARAGTPGYNSRAFRASPGQVPILDQHVATEWCVNGDD